MAQDEVQKGVDEYFKSVGQSPDAQTHDDPDKAAEAYLKEHHETSPDGKGNVYENVDIDVGGNADKRETTEAPGYLAPAGGVAGGYAAYKGFGTKMLSPGEGVFRPSAVQPPKPAAPKAPSVRIEPNMGEPMSGLDHAVDPYDARVDEIMQSERGKGEPTGKQMRQGHNMEAQREKWALEENLGQHGQGAKKEIVKFGASYPLESGISVSEQTGRKIEEEKAKKAEAEARARAHAQVAREQAEAQAKVEAEAKKTAQAEAQKAAEAKAEKEAAAKGMAKGVGKVAAGVLGGAMAAPDFWDAYQEWKKNGWTDEAITKALQGVGGAAMAIPTPFTEVGGLGLNLAAPYLVKKFGPHNKPRSEMQRYELNGMAQ